MKIIQIVLLATFAASLSANGYTGELTCNLCIDIVKAVEDFLEDGHNQDDIIAIAEASSVARGANLLIHYVLQIQCRYFPLGRG